MCLFNPEPSDNFEKEVNFVIVDYLCFYILLFAFSGDRLTDERVQSAQAALSNGDTPFERLEGFISKIEDFHRLMNFLEVCLSPVSRGHDGV